MYSLPIESIFTILKVIAHRKNGNVLGTDRYLRPGGGGGGGGWGWFSKKCSVSKLNPPKKFGGKNYTLLPNSCLKNVPPPPPSPLCPSLADFLSFLFNISFIFSLVYCLNPLNERGPKILSTKTPFCTFVAKS